MSESKPSVKLVANYYIWNKGDHLPVSANYGTNDFTCHCSYPDCKEQKISKDLVDKIELIRTEVKQSLTVTSAFRCQKYQAFLRASGVNTVVAKLSQHEVGNAADIQKVDKDMTGFEDICAKHFTSIGRAKTFLHCDLRPGFRRWLY